ncbi:hypothetical protein GXW71_33290 [Roseomonas hellenica]|uniref:TerB family tellurite resistance protein n=1 Tax=Plastoroseomonas hellenica TaxID=2687306 RepID=A0ABS5F9N6_9PROT|nr:hypothetical protein [Plastoroseomonas hellenica]MBR0669272.1 hypothetical protein [Plastoroseomonas hellenica]
MGEEFLGDRKRALEEAFFAKEDQRLRRQLREADEARSRREALAAASGIADDAVLDAVAALGMTGETLAALTLVPLVAVAWADGAIDDREREAVLAAAAEAGVAAQGAARELLDRWLREPPPRELLAAWADYTRAVSAKLDDAGLQALRAELVGRARRVAEASGGFLGLGRKVSDAEEAVLRRLEAAFPG